LVFYTTILLAGSELFGAENCQTPFTTEKVPKIFVKELARVTGIEVSVEETKISWNVQVDKKYEDCHPNRIFLR
jgi:hypothetical protein